MTKPIFPPATIGIIGGGQLGMMTIREAQRMGYRSIVWDPTPECPASRLADETITAPFEDHRAAHRLAMTADVVTYEFEHIDPSAVEVVAKLKPVFPGIEILKISQHRRIEKESLQKAGFPVAPFRVVQNGDELQTAVRDLSYPVVIKTTTAGYDGKGQAVLEGPKDLETFLSVQQDGIPESVVERFLSLMVELSVLAVRSKDGSVTTFPVVENEHRENILHATRVPARIPEAVRKRAELLGRSVIEHFGLVGVLCIEMFVTFDGEVLVNELAPRPHNSGHFSLDACSMSQFEALIRAVCGLPVPQPRLLSSCAMINLLGKHLPRVDFSAAQQPPGVKIHLYGKRKIEPKRKMGHVTIVNQSEIEIEQCVQLIETMIGEPARVNKRDGTEQQKKVG